MSDHDLSRDEAQAGSAAAEPASAEGSGDEPFGFDGDVAMAEDLVDDITLARREAAEYLDMAQRLQADFDNYRRRVQREREESVDGAPLARNLLEVLDEFELALMAAEQEPNLATFLRGVEMVYAKLLDSLRAAGVERIEAEGQPFDPELHEALMHGGDSEGEPVVAEVLRHGYTIKGRVLRPAGVKVAGGH
jgi:molecular chaperone GrpE